jgi:hypothetical protein
MRANRLVAERLTENDANLCFLVVQGVMQPPEQTVLAGIEVKSARRANGPHRTLQQMGLS